MAAMQPTLLTTYDPTSSVVGNGIPGQVTATIQPAGTNWIITTRDLPGLVSTGEFPNPQNPNSINAQSITLNWPLRGGYNFPSQQPTYRPLRGFVGMSAVGIPFVGPQAGYSVAGGRGTVWNINSVSAEIYGGDSFSGNVGTSGEYNYNASGFITNNAWASIPAFATGYRHLDGHSKIIGWAIDGYPIYGPYGYQNASNATSLVVKMAPSYQLKTNPVNRPGNVSILTRGATTKSNYLTVTSTANVAPGMILTGGSLPGPVKVLGTGQGVLILDTRVNVSTNQQLTGNYPMGIFIEDYEYQANSGDLDRSNGRFCVTPEYPNGTYAYFATQNSNDEPIYPYLVGNQLYGSLQITALPVAPAIDWVTPAGSLGTLVVGKFFQIPILAEASSGATVSYAVIAGNLPDGVAINQSGVISGVPTLGGVPTLSDLGELGQDITSKFVVRAYTTTTVNGQSAVLNFLDQTFTLTVPGAQLAQFETPAGNIGNYYDGSPIEPIQLLFNQPLYNAVVEVAGGSLPPGLTVSSTGLISGFIEPALVGGMFPGYDLTPEDVYGYDFLAVAESFNYQFTLEITDGRNSNLRTFEIYVISKNNLTADGTVITADTTLVTADETPDRPPFITTPEGDLGTFQDDNYFAFQFQAQDLDQQNYEFVLIIDSGDDYNWSIPQGLTLDPLSGWLYGYLPQQGLSSITYTIALRVQNVNPPFASSGIYLYTMTVVSGIDTRVTWLSPATLGTIDNGGTSLFSIEAVSNQNSNLAYRLVSGSDSKLPMGLQLMPSGHIVGSVSYDTFTLDTGTTTFDVTKKTFNNTGETTFDLTYSFDVNVYSPTTQQIFYKVSGFTVQDGGEQYTNPTVTVATPVGSGVRATVASVGLTFVPGSGNTISSVTLLDGGSGYQTAPVVTITDSTGSGALITANVSPVQTGFLISEVKRFTIKVNRAYQAPLDSLYIEGMLSEENRQLITGLLEDPALLPPEDIFRADDLNFGIARNLIYAHAFGLNAETAEVYQEALSLNHYWKNLLLGPVQTARALDANKNVIYEVLYCPVIDNLVNAAGESVSKEVTLDFPVLQLNGEPTYIDTVYPNALVDMRDQVIDQVGQVGTILPLWMTSLQENGKQLGYVPAWVIAYVNPGTSLRLAYYINQIYANRFNTVNFTVDRYILDRKLSYNWDPVGDSTGGTWVPPASSTTFDQNAHYRVPENNDSSIVFNGGSGYEIGSVLRIRGSLLGGFDGFNDLTITVLEVGTVGEIINYSLSGQAEPLTQGTIYYNIPAQTILGTGSGSTWDLVVASGDATIFDGNSLQFNVPVDIYGVTDQFNKYLVFPKRNILQ